jgi:predicted TIM-barrel fold metal-dependent hydrolase
LGDEPPCEEPIWSPETDEAVKAGTLAVMERRNVFGVLSGTTAMVEQWSSDAPDRFLRGLGFRVGMGVSPDSLRRLHEAGKIEVLAEVTNQYLGLSPDDPGMEPYWELAERLDLPVGIHIGPGPPGVVYFGAPKYRARLHSPLSLEEVLVRHPGLRVYVMHAGYPMLDDLLALMYAHPQVHVGVGVIVNALPREGFYRYLRAIMESGFGKRVMFGSDQMVWPEMIERGITAIEEAPFLSESQKRDILYDNAARFFEFSPELIRQHWAGSE